MLTIIIICLPVPCQEGIRLPTLVKSPPSLGTESSSIQSINGRSYLLPSTDDWLRLIHPTTWSLLISLFLFPLQSIQYQNLHLALIPILFLLHCVKLPMLLLWGQFPQNFEHSYQHRSYFHLEPKLSIYMDYLPLKHHDDLLIKWQGQKSLLSE